MLDDWLWEIGVCVEYMELWSADAGDESDDEGVGGAYYEAKASKKEKKRQEREAQRQVQY